MTVNGHRLWVEREGHGEPLLLLAGLGPAGSHIIFHPWFSEIGQAYEVIYVDLWGRGRSDAPADLAEVTFAGDVADIAALIDVLRIRPVHVYGFSYGGLIAQQLACEHPSLLRSVVLANSLHSPEMWQRSHENLNREFANQHPDTWQRILASRATGAVSTDEEPAGLFSSMSRYARFYDPRNADLVPSEHGDRHRRLTRAFGGDDVHFMVGGQVAQIPDFRRRLASISVPILVLAGRYDRALYPALQQQFEAHGAGVELVYLERSGSFGHVEEPLQVRTQLGSFHRSRRVIDRMIDLYGAI